MKNKLIIFLVSLLLTSAVIGQEEGEDKPKILKPDALTPSRTTLFIEIPNIERATNTLSTFSKNFDIEGKFDNVINWINTLKQRIHKKILNDWYLGMANVNVEKPLYIAYLEDSYDTGKLIMFIPVTDEEKFPLMFTKMLKKMSNKPKLDLNPVITGYKEYKIYQILQDIFFTTIDDYFILTYSGEIVREIIDIKSRETTDVSLSDDLLYIDYKEKKKENHDINLFIKGKFLKRAKISAIFDIDNENKENEPSKDSINNEKNKLSKPSEQNQDIRNSRFDFIDYIGFGLRSEENKINIKTYLSVNKEDPFAKLLTSMFTTGLSENSLFITDPIAYYFLSVNMNFLENSFKTPSNRENSLFNAYTMTKLFLKQNLSINIDRIFSPYFGDLFNFVISKQKKRKIFDNFILYIPVTNCPDNEMLFTTVKDSMKKRFKKAGSFGEKKIDTFDSFWFTDRIGNKITMCVIDKNVYIGNNANFIRTAIKNKDRNLLDMSNEFKKKVDKNTFLLCYTKFDDESLLKVIIGMLAIRINPKLGALIDKIDSVNLIGKKIDNNFTFDLCVKMLPEE